MTTTNLLLSPAAHHQEIILLKLDSRELQDLYNYLHQAIAIIGERNKVIESLHSEVYFALQECQQFDRYQKEGCKP